MMRLFIALPLPAEVERSLGKIIQTLRPKTDAVKWVASENIHLTVKFLGDTEERMIPDLKSAIDEIAGRHSQIETVLDRVGAFPNLRRPRVFWVGGSTPMEEAARMAGEIDELTHRLGWDKETRGFKAHLTLGRVRQGKRADGLSQFLDSYRLSPISLHLDRLTLFKSTLTPQGAIYERLHECLLGRKEFAG